ncbi:GAF domain-containing SpoIIE family protein phosphatase [Actinoplanes sp. NPDC049265]|uniref:GAF domain-containing SpoIIE family protein phosphatase n=1 Tax=Actinoplanes sp. NPDC049265 TaxID=3363902 RepID=UPI00372248C9
MSGEVPVGLAATDRLAALRRTGLSAAADPVFDRFAEMVRNVVGVPVALVTLVEADRQIFPGAQGLGEPWQAQRYTPLSHSFCQHVVVSAEPLVITDARTDPRVTGNLAITDLDVIGYAGMPLTDADGLVLGSLCAIDTAPREWTPRELGLLADLAAACSDSLRLRVATGQARRQEYLAGAAYERSQLLLNASATLANTATAEDVVAAVRDLVTGTLDPAYVGLSLVDGDGRVLLQSGDSLPTTVAARWRRYPVSAGTPSALAARTGAPVLLPDLAAVAAAVPAALPTFNEMGWQAAASLPLPSPTGSLGALTFVWKQPTTLRDEEQTVLAALAGYVAEALHRADYLSYRENVAAVLQRAMLTDLPEAAPYELAALYQPAARGEQVGGDWYDAIRLDHTHLTLVVGDVTGHDIAAAARMGQLRSMLRAYLVDRHEPPSALLRRLDTANHLLGERALATAVLGYVRPDTATGGHRLHWSNAGHPAPLLLGADGVVAELSGHDTLLGVQRRTPRNNHTRLLPPGSTLLFYTDGLTETRGRPFDEREAELREVLAGLVGTPLPDLLPELLTRVAGETHEDDVAMLALRTPDSR